MSNDQSYRPRSPDLPGLTQSQQHQQPPLRLNRLPSYQIQEPSLPKGYSFSPRGSYDASPFFSQHNSNLYPGVQQGSSYPDQSPPRFTPASLPDQAAVYSPVSYYSSPQRFANSTPQQKPTFQIPSYQQSPSQYQGQVDEMARLRSRKPVNYNEDHAGPQYEEPLSNYTQPPAMPQMPQMPPQPQQVLQYPPTQQFMQQPMNFAPAPPSQQEPVRPPLPPAPPMPQVDVKTKFPVARIKRIMQADEDVGKVAQATPTAVSKALELFMIALVTKGATEANKSGTKRVTATHLKHALLTDPQFDFLNEICEAVPDEGGKSSKSRAKSEAKSEDSDEEMAGTSKKKAKGSRKKKGTDDDGSD